MILGQGPFLCVGVGVVAGLDGRWGRLGEKKIGEFVNGEWLMGEGLAGVVV